MSIGKRGPCANPAKNKASSIKTKRPTMPARMSAGAKAEWKRIVPELFKNNMLVRFDQGGLEALCETKSMCVKGWKFLDENGLTYKAPSGIWHARPEVALLNQASGRLLQWSKAFGLTPDARDGMTLPEQTTEDDFDKESRA